MLSLYIRTYRGIYIHISKQISYDAINKSQGRIQHLLHDAAVNELDFNALDQISTHLFFIPAYIYRLLCEASPKK